MYIICVCISLILLLHIAVAPGAVNTTQCNNGQFYCGADSTYPCISSTWVCDRDRDCSNGADEASCGVYYDSIIHKSHRKQGGNYPLASII